MEIKVKRISEHATIPRYATPGSACFDLHSADESKTIRGRVVIKTGLQFEIPDGHVMLVFSRSGHGFKQGVRLANCVGIIDSDFRGEVLVALTRDETAPETHLAIVNTCDRVAQAMVIPVEQVKLILSDSLSETERGENGYGSTGR